MRFSSYLLAAGLSALTLSAPVDRDRDDECDREPELIKKVHKPTHSSKIKLHSTVSIPVSSSTLKPLEILSTSTIISVPTTSSLTEHLETSSTSTPISSPGVTVPTSSSTTTFSSALLILESASSSPGSSSATVSSTTVISISISSPAVELLATPSSSTFTSSTSIPLAIPTTSAMPSFTKLFSSSSRTAAVSSSTAAVSSSTSKPGALQWLGANESGAEFGSNIPGTLGTDYIFPDTTSIQTLMNQGMNIFRIPFLMERLAPSAITGSFDAAYLSGLQNVVSFITAAGAHAILDPHNYGRYYGNIITSTSDFQTFWTNLASEFSSNDKVIFDCNNEFHDMPSNDLVVGLNQACINGVRAAGATTQYIFVEGTAWSGAWSWTTSGNSDCMGNLTDPYDKIVYEMHQYLDSDASGTSSTCVSTTIGAERIAAATAWLRANNKKGIIGEFAGGVNTQCETAVTGMLDALVAANDVWMGALWWGAGPWWGDYIFSLEPPSGTAYSTYIDVLTNYV